MVIGALGASLRRIPQRLWDLFLHHTTCSIIFSDQDVAEQWFKWWFQQQPAAKKIRRTDVYTPWTNHSREAFLIPAPGTHWIWRKHRPFRIVFERAEATKSYEKRKESFSVQTFGRSNRFLQEFLLEVKEAFENQSKAEPQLYVRKQSEWEIVTGYTPRTLDSIVLDPSIKEYLVKDIVKFQQAESWYADKGIPYHRCYLFHGLPGTGKTSIINGLASKLNMNVYILNLQALSDERLLEAISEANQNSMFIMEDIDSISATKNRENKENDSEDKGVLKMELLTMSGVLNALDGIMTPKGAIFVMTTNHIEKLDPALLREGRCDVKLYFGNMDIDRQIEMYNKYFSDGKATEFLTNNEPVTACVLQERLLQEHRKREVTKEEK